MLDVDSTLIEQEVIDELAKIVGRGEMVSQITARAMAGELDFESALRQRVKLLAGAPISILDHVQAKITLTQGAEELIATLQSKGVRIGVVSGGFEAVIAPLAKKLELDFYRANHLEIKGEFLTGELSGPIIGRDEKGDALAEFAASFGIGLDESIAIGDGANDIEMIRRAGLGIAFCAKEVLKLEADLCLDIRDLREVVNLLD